ncbi:MAG: RNA 2',3'-cyclic phosphodiesterase [Terracidiphilus sp.]
MRLFVGIPLADDGTSELSALVSRLQPKAGDLRWTAPDSWHITLQFLGNATPAQFECLTARLGEVRYAPVAIELGAAGSFERAGVIFAEVIVAPGLAALQQHIVAATAQCGFVAETRPFHPHITLARKARNKGAREQGSKGTERSRQGSLYLRGLVESARFSRFLRFMAHEFLLYESHLGSEGSRYEVRARFPLGGRSS